MQLKDMIMILLEVIENNFNLEESNDYKTFISSSISFLKKDKEFTKLLPSNDKEDVERLIKLSDELKELNEVFKGKSLEYICSFMFKNNEKILGDEKNKNETNKMLNYNFFIEDIDYVKLSDNIYADCKNRGIENDVLKMKAFLKICNLLSLFCLDNKNINDVNKILKLNDISREINKEFTEHRNTKKTSLFGMLYGYENLIKENDLNIKSKDLKLLKELVDEDGPFKGLTKKEIVELLYSYIMLNNRACDLVSTDSNYIFKDLSPVSEIIKRRTKENQNGKQIILSLANNKNSFKFNNQSSRYK